MTDATDTMVGILPPLILGGVLLKMSDNIFPNNRGTNTNITTTGRDKLVDTFLESYSKAESKADKTKIFNLYMARLQATGLTRVQSRKLLKEYLDIYNQEEVK